MSGQRLQVNPKDLIPQQTKRQMSGSVVKKLAANMKMFGYDQMTSPYNAVFLLPPGTEKRLGDVGWEFSSSQRLPSKILHLLANELHLEKGNSYLGLDIYVGDGMKLTATADARGIGHIYLQFWAGSRSDIAKAVAGQDVEVFIPSDVKSS